MLVDQTEGFRADTRNSPETSMALRNQRDWIRSRLGVPCLLEGARAEARNGALTALPAGSNSTSAYRSATAGGNDFVPDAFSGVLAKLLANYKYHYEEQSSIVAYRVS